MEIQKIHSEALKHYSCMFTCPDVNFERGTKANNLKDVLKRLNPELEKKGIKNRIVDVQLPANILVMQVTPIGRLSLSNELEEAYSLINGIFGPGAEYEDLRTYVIRTYEGNFQFYFELSHDFDDIFLSCPVDDRVVLIKALTASKSTTPENGSGEGLMKGHSLCSGGISLEGSFQFFEGELLQSTSVDQDSILKLPYQLEFSLFSSILAEVFLQDKKPIMVG